MKSLEYPFSGNDILKNRKAIRRELLSGLDGKQQKKKIAILGGSTTRDVMLMLELFLLNNDIEPVFYESEYAQYYQDAMFPNAELEAFGPDIIYIHTSNRNIEAWPTTSSSKEETEELLRTAYHKFTGMWDRIRDVYHCPVIQNNFELPFYRLMGNKDISDYRGKSNFLSRLNQLFYEYAQDNANFYIHDIQYEQACFGLDEWSNPYYWHMYKYFCNVSAIPYMAFNIANIIKSIYGKNRKALMLDLDNTLWGGVIGDDGADNIEVGQETNLGQAYSEFQYYIKEHKQLGVVLTINSKNEEVNALAGLQRPDSVLKEDDFVAIKANWETKSKNLEDVASDLALLPESFVFVDDNPAEREIIRQCFPGTAVPEINEVEQYIQTLDKSGYFEVTELSNADLKRVDMYRANAERVRQQAEYTDYGKYLESLEMRGEIREFIPMYMSRIAQLTNKSNQFNLTTRRYNQAEIEKIASDPNCITLYGKLVDKFGDNGVVSVVIGSKKGNELHIDLWLMSCRVLKREMETAMMDKLVSKCREQGITHIYGYYFPTKKNGMVKEFYARYYFEKLKEDGEGNTVWHLEISKYVFQNKYIEVN